jgi:Kef-type K+ transport system membrane component KefB
MNSPVPPRFDVPPPIPVHKPSVVRWYRLWCALFIPLWLGVVVYAVLKAKGEVEDLGPFTELLVKDDQAARDALLAEEREEAIGGAALGGIFLLFYIFAACVPRRPWAWVVGMIAIIGTMFPFCLPAAGAVPLLVFWVKPETKRYFGRSAQADSARL